MYMYYLYPHIYECTHIIVSFTTHSYVCLHTHTHTRCLIENERETDRERPLPFCGCVFVRLEVSLSHGGIIRVG